MKTFASIAFTPRVQSLQAARGSRAIYERVPNEMPLSEGLGPHEVTFLQRADSFYMASVGETGWPYVQHRGGPRGFLRVLSPTRIAFADFRGNRQYVSAGNVVGNDRVALIIMDYVQRRRLKLFGHLSYYDIESANTELVSAVKIVNYRAQVERVAEIQVEAFDWNCPKHITPRVTFAELASEEKLLRTRVAQLEAELAEIRNRIEEPSRNR